MTKSARYLVPTIAIALFGACAKLMPDSYRYGAVEVEVRDTAGAPVAAAHLTLYIGVHPMAYGDTGPDGHYPFDFVPADVYGVYLNPPPGYHLPDGALPYQYVEVTQGETEDLSFELAPN